MKTVKALIAALEKYHCIQALTPDTQVLHQQPPDKPGKSPLITHASLHSQALIQFCHHPVPFSSHAQIVICQQPTSHFVSTCREHGVACYQSHYSLLQLKLMADEFFIQGIRAHHGVVITLGKVGLLLTGVSGIGKSQLAYRLLKQAHAQLVVDDAPDLNVRQGQLYASCPEEIVGKLHLRDQGLVDIRQQFGEQALLKQVAIQRIVKLGAWPAGYYATEPSTVTLKGVSLIHQVVSASAFEQLIVSGSGNAALANGPSQRPQERLCA